MKKENKITNITVIVGIVLSMLVGRAKSIGFNRLSNIDDYTNMHYLPFSTIVSETSKLKLEDYAKEDTHYEFVKNMLADDNNEINSKNTEDIIVIEPNNKSFKYLSDCFMYTCFYREVEENGIKKKKYIPYEEITGEDKKMLIVLKSTNNQLMDQIQEAKNRLANPKQDTKIKAAIELMKKIVNQTMYWFYINNTFSNTNSEIIQIKEQLEIIEMTKTIAYSLFSRPNLCSIQYNLRNLFRDFENQIKTIKKIQHKDDLYSITEDNEEQMKLVFLKDSRTIAAQIMDRKQNYGGKTGEDIRNDFCDDLKMFINKLTNDKVDLDNHTYIRKKQLKKEIEKIEDEEIKSMLHEAADKCPLKNNEELSIGQLYSKINNRNTNLFYFIVNFGMKTKSSITKEIEEKVNDMLNRIISNRNIELSFKPDEIVEEAKIWNRNLVSLICSLITKYTKLNGIEEELIEHITADSAQIASEILNNRQEKYNTHTNMFAIQSIVENELIEIMRIIEKRYNTVKLEKDMVAKENEQIIKLLEIISNKSDNATEEETQVIKELKCISEGKYNPEEEQKEKNELQDKQKDTQRNIRSILSEIEQEFIEEEDYQVTYETINNKKKEIVDMVVDKLSIVTMIEDGYRTLQSARKTFKKIVEGIVDVLIDSVIDRTQHKGLKKVEEEIENEAKYIKSQDLKKILDLDLTSNLDSDGCLGLCSFLALHYFDESSYVFITKMLNLFIREHNYGSNAKLIEFLCSFSILCKLDAYIDNLKTYDEFWLKPVSFTLYNETIYLNHKSGSASIKYRNNNEKLQIKKVTPTDDNLQAFIRAKTEKDIEKIREIGNECCIS